MRNRRTNQKGFTLIELLIVIAIIGILAAVLIPNLLGARKRAYYSAHNVLQRAMKVHLSARVGSTLRNSLVIPFRYG